MSVSISGCQRLSNADFKSNYNNQPPSDDRNVTIRQDQNQQQRDKPSTIETKTDVQDKDFILIVHDFPQIHSIYIFCADDEFGFLTSLSDRYSKVWGIYSVRQRLLFKLSIDISLRYTQIGDDHNRSDQVSQADSNYKRSQNIYKKMIEYLNK
ncbi:unnamed protein product [Didymodactylos carnosus]|uniref:Uncharacterized protein n=1 Tax=Didymodactylos carnosus TaxID=1234261 RepID=A0A814G300_9BILA|nr:unnamed protein product [Didymodactylos carnosus]CAF0992098.1 unnamed protein product [Didymodactylos carnosus]CAF3538804.1 unnamed protein product [Didymodactylos carnosus]CAF3764014.1 unnamed protein product [Didymodactylos carnosus]